MGKRDRKSSSPGDARKEVEVPEVRRNQKMRIDCENFRSARTRLDSSSGWCR